MIVLFPDRPRAETPALDPGRPASQFWGGLGVYAGTVVVGGVGFAVAAASEDGGAWARAAGYTSMGIMLAAPALAGATVCTVGRRSPHFDGGCGAPIAAAYAGLLASTGLFLLSDQFSSAPLTWSAVLGVLVLPPAAAVAGWELGKHPVSPAVGRSARVQAPPRPHAHGGALAPDVLGARLLSGSF